MLMWENLQKQKETNVCATWQGRKEYCPELEREKQAYHIGTHP